MKDRRHDNLAEALREEAAYFFSRESSGQSLITVTRVIVSSDNRRATVYITVLPESEERAALSFANRHVRRLRQAMQSHRRIGHVPELTVELDAEQRHQQHLDELSQ